jgi:signal peptidase I
MQLHHLLLVALPVCSCAKKPTGPFRVPDSSGSETHSSNSKFPSETDILMEKDHAGDDLLTVKVSVTNRSEKRVPFVQHPEHQSISILAADRAVKIPLVTYVRSDQSDLVQASPGETVVFRDSFSYRQPKKNLIKVGDPVFPEQGMEIWDENLRASFSYDWYPTYLPEGSNPKSPKWVKVRIAATRTITMA